MDYKKNETYTIKRSVYVYKAPFITASHALKTPYWKNRKVKCYGTLSDPDGNIWMRVISQQTFRYIPAIYKGEVIIQ